MKKKSITVGTKQFLVPRVTVQQMMDMIETQHAARRQSLIADLEDAGASSEVRVQKLREFSEQNGLMSNVIREAFTVRGAVWIISEAYEGNFPEEFNELLPDDLSRVALHIIGFDPDEQDEESAEGKASSESNQENG